MVNAVLCNVGRYYSSVCSPPQQVWQDEMIEGLIEGQGEEEGEEGEESDGVLLNKRPVLAANKKTLQQRRREQERKMKVHVLQFIFEEWNKPT